MQTAAAGYVGAAFIALNAIRGRSYLDAVICKWKVLKFENLKIGNSYRKGDRNRTPDTSKI